MGKKKRIIGYAMEMDEGNELYVADDDDG